MSIATEITRLQTAKANIKTAIENKGVTVPSSTTLSGYSTLINSITPQVTLQEKIVTPSSVQQIITPDSGYDGLSKVTVNYVHLESPTATPTTSTQVITPSTQGDGWYLSQVTVNPVTSSIDSNIQAGNIKKNVSILGVTGTLEEGITPSGTLTLTGNTSGTDCTNYATVVVAVPDWNGSVT